MSKGAKCVVCWKMEAPVGVGIRERLCPSCATRQEQVEVNDFIVVMASDKKVAKTVAKALDKKLKGGSK
ncbi:MAG: hypothetical protein ACKN9R_05160 [Candidatus Limnocylindrus sp.]